MSHHTVSILNPVIGGNRYASLDLARKLVRGGHAWWVDEARYRLFLMPEYRVSLAGFAYRDARDAALGYDGILKLRDRNRGPLTIREMTAIPIANPKKAMGFGKARRKGTAVGA